MLSPNQLREKVLRTCPVCHGSGITEDSSECACARKYKILVSMLINSFPEEHVIGLHDGELPLRYQMLSGNEYFTQFKQYPGECIERGSSLIFSGHLKASLAASHLVYLVLEQDYTRKCRFYDGGRILDDDDYEADILVIDTAGMAHHPEIAKITVQRDRKLRSMFIAIPHPGEMSEWPIMAEALGWETGERFKSDSFKHVKIGYIQREGRWSTPRT